MNHIKRLWGYYLTLLVLLATLAFPIYSIHQFFGTRFGSEVALIALTLTIMIVLIFVDRGAMRAHMLMREWNHDHGHETVEVQEASCLPNRQGDAPIHPAMENVEGIHLSFPKGHRGKPPRFPREQIRKAVLKWERRDPSISALTLEQFLAQEFGSSPDGILLMATTTFYDWRRRILKETEGNGPKS